MSKDSQIWYERYEEDKENRLDRTFEELSHPRKKLRNTAFLDGEKSERIFGRKKTRIVKKGHEKE